MAAMKWQQTRTIQALQSWLLVFLPSARTLEDSGKVDDSEYNAAVSFGYKEAVPSGIFYDDQVNVNALSSRTVEGLAALSYSKHIMSTLVLLFYLFGLPVIVVILVLLWRAYLNVCENCERTMSRRHSVTYSVVDMQDFRLRHECCKKNVAPILFSLPTDFNFKHNCGAKCKGPKVWQPENFP